MCKDCRHFQKCRWLLSRKGTEQECDWLPSRFKSVKSRRPSPDAPNLPTNEDMSLCTDT